MILVRITLAGLLGALTIAGVGILYGFFAFGFASYTAGALLAIVAAGAASVVLRLARIQRARGAVTIGLTIAVGTLCMGYATFWDVGRTAFEFDVDVAYEARLETSSGPVLMREDVRREILLRRFGGSEPGFLAFAADYARTTTIHWTRMGTRSRNRPFREGDRAGGWIWLAWLVQAALFLVLVPHGARHGAARALPPDARPRARPRRVVPIPWPSEDPGEVLIERYGAEPQELLSRAVRAGNRRAFDAACAAGAALDRPSANGDPPLVAAARYGNASVEWLLGAGASVEAPDQSGNRPLHAAC